MSDQNEQHSDESAKGASSDPPRAHTPTPPSGETPVGNLARGRTPDDLNEARREAALGRVVRLERASVPPTDDQPLWVAIRNQTQAVGFDNYFEFINRVLCGEADDANAAAGEQGFGSPSLSARRQELSRRPSIQGVDAYKLLKLATEAFLLFRCGVNIDKNQLDLDEERARLATGDNSAEIASRLGEYLGSDPGALPYLKRIVAKLTGSSASARKEGLPYCESLLRRRLTCPSLIELIWSYWHEEGMLVQTMNALTLRFQNRRSGPNDPLVGLTLDPLRPMSNLLWGFVQDEQNRLSLRRRAYEYDSHYGFRLMGKALEGFEPIDSRTKFVKAFHNLLHRAVQFYREDDDTTVVADAFALLNALREVHIILAEGAHNQYGDLPWTARREMLIMQWLLTRPEIREFIRGRHMVPYQEPWMGAVDDMKRLKGWSDTSVTHYHELAIYGEQLLLSVRFGDWIDINNQDLAKNWARYWRAEIQRYIHGYHAVTGVDLSADISDGRTVADRYALPAALIHKRLSTTQPAALTGASNGRLRLPTARGRGHGSVVVARRLPRSV